MNLYRISQTVNEDYDTFDSAIVAAETEDEARRIHPIDSWHHGRNDCMWRDGTENDEWVGRHPTWATHPDQVAVALIGVASPNVSRGVVLASYRPG